MEIQTTKSGEALRDRISLLSHEVPADQGRKCPIETFIQLGHSMMRSDMIHQYFKLNQKIENTFECHKKRQN